METKTTNAVVNAADPDKNLQSVANDVPEGGFKMYATKKMEHANKEYNAGEQVVFMDRDSMKAQLLSGSVSKEAPTAE